MAAAAAAAGVFQFTLANSNPSRKGIAKYIENLPCMSRWWLEIVDDHRSSPARSTLNRKELQKKKNMMQDDAPSLPSRLRQRLRRRRQRRKEGRRLLDTLFQNLFCCVLDHFSRRCGQAVWRYEINSSLGLALFWIIATQNSFAFDGRSAGIVGQNFLFPRCCSKLDYTLLIVLFD